MIGWPGRSLSEIDGFEADKILQNRILMSLHPRQEDI
jgi:hypothetical protein